MPDRVPCPDCGKDHRVRVSGSMHYIRCKKRGGARFFVGWNDVYMVNPPAETSLVREISI